jgi:Cohesin domain
VRFRAPLSLIKPMKPVHALIFAIILIFSSVFVVNAQTSESVWLATNTTAFKRGETVSVTFNGISVTPIQGFTFQIRYDPACLQPINAASPIAGMNGLSLPQTAGLVDASFASTTPQIANGVLAEVKFQALAGCQTVLTLESAGLAIKNASGFAAQLPGVTIGQKDIALSIDNAAGAAQDQPLLGTPLALGPQAASDGKDPVVTTALLVMVGVVIVIFVIMFVVYRVLRR